jgi:simple sugar transport system substrate-binding protein
LAEAVCLGVPFFNWGPSYLEVARSVMDGSFAPTFQWLGPDWSDINNADTSAVGFVKGAALTEEESASLDEFIAGLGDGSINLWTGPLNYQDGTEFVAEGATATDLQIWYMSQLLQGVEGASSAE